MWGRTAHIKFLQDLPERGLVGSEDHVQRLRGRGELLVLRGRGRHRRCRRFLAPSLKALRFVLNGLRHAPQLALEEAQERARLQQLVHFRLARRLRIGMACTLHPGFLARHGKLGCCERVHVRLDAAIVLDLLLERFVGQQRVLQLCVFRKRRIGNALDLLPELHPALPRPRPRAVRATGRTDCHGR